MSSQLLAQTSGGEMWKFVSVCSLLASAALTGPAAAGEFGFGGFQQGPGLSLDFSAEVPPQGLYTFDEPFTVQSHIIGPGAPHIDGNSTPLKVSGIGIGLLYVPGWTLFGAEYSLLTFQPFFGQSFGAPINESPFGVHNTLIEPIGLTWRIGDSGFYAKVELGTYVPDGTIRGTAGLSNIGTPWFTFEPEFIISYLKYGWAATARSFAEINSKNYHTGYTSGTVFHEELSATRDFGRWRFGPVAYYAGQVSNDQSSAFYQFAVGAKRTNDVGVGGLIGYKIGPLNIEAYALYDVLSNASGGTASLTGDSAIGARGVNVFLRASYPLFVGEAAAAPVAPKVTARY